MPKSSTIQNNSTKLSILVLLNQFSLSLVNSANLIIKRTFFSTGYAKINIELTFNSQNPKAFEILCQKLREYDSNFVNQLKNNPRYLAQAIKNNNPDMVTTILREFDYQSNQECIKQISLSLSAVNKTDVTLLKNLKEHGMEFSTAANNLIREKDEKKIGVLDQFGIALMRFSEFLKKHLLRQTEEIKITGDIPEVEKKSPKYVIETESDDEVQESVFHEAHLEKKQESNHYTPSSMTKIEAFQAFKNKLCSILSSSKETEQNAEENDETFRLRSS